MEMMRDRTSVLFQHTAARRRLAELKRAVSVMVGFNTQPPEGGWMPTALTASNKNSFNTQPPEGGWTDIEYCRVEGTVVSTHSRPKAAGCIVRENQRAYGVSTHSHPKAAGSLTDERLPEGDVSTHSRPKAAGPRLITIFAPS